LLHKLPGYSALQTEHQLTGKPGFTSVHIASYYLFNLEELLPFCITAFSPLSDEYITAFLTEYLRK
jgi:hypothetical protein